MKRVVYAWNYLEWGGAQIYILGLIKEVRKEFEPLIVLPFGSNPQMIHFLDELDIKYEFFKGYFDKPAARTIPGKLRIHWIKLRNEFAMIRHIRRLDPVPAVVHVELGPNQSLLALAVLCMRTPVFITGHNRLGAGPVRELLWKAKFGIASLLPNLRIFCANEDARTFFRQYYRGAKAKEIEVTYASINPREINDVLESDLDREALLRRLGIPSDRPIVLSVGQFIDRKGRWTLLNAAKEVVRKNREVLFLWITPNMPGEAELEQINAFGLGDSFRLILSDAIGKQRKDILTFFRVADTFALPSFIEGLPIALLEAMALGIPSISTSVNGIPEAVKNRETGLLIEAGDSGALANAILDLIRDKELSDKLGQAGREFVIEHFDERKAALTALHAYKRAIGSN